jgi:HEAT repeat protein
MARLLYCMVAMCALVAGSTAQCPVALADMAQNADEVLNQPRGLAYIERELTEMGIPLTGDCLLLALQSDKITVRKLVAGEAATKGVKEAVPVIERMMKEETDPYGKIGLAWDLAVLNEERGLQTLEGYCDNSKEDIAIRLQAARVLEVNLKQKSCPEVLITALHDPEPTFRQEALSLLPEATDLSAKDFLRLHNLLLKSLSDQHRSVQIEAANTVTKLGDVSFIPELQKVVAKESDPEVKQAMTAALSSLQSKQT